MLALKFTTAYISSSLLLFFFFPNIPGPDTEKEVPSVHVGLGKMGRGGDGPIPETKQRRECCVDSMRKGTGASREVMSSDQEDEEESE